MSPLVNREPIYFGVSGLFGWFHWNEAVPQRDCAAVLCSPFGHEYVHSHRTFRHLADRFAGAGMPALRFDYPGAGDSRGSETDTGRWPAWEASVHEAIAETKRLSGRERICLVGMRLGASLAARVAAATRVDLLVLWEPCVKGSRYLRELQAIAASASASSSGEGTLEAAGFVLTPAAAAAIRDLDLMRDAVAAERVLLVRRDDLVGEPSLAPQLHANGTACDEIAVSGHAAMMAEPQFTVLPEAAMQSIVDWAARYSAPFSGHVATPAARTCRMSGGVDERHCRFGRQGELFGIMCAREGVGSSTAVVMFNAGAVHHVGPNRLYVTLARRLARAGIASLRFDLAGLGDSVLARAGRENHPYPERAVDDARAALEHLRDRFGVQRFVLLGLCSGAHTAFHAAIEIADLEIAEIVLINPLTFNWVEGMSLETSRRFGEVAYYRKSARNPRRWLKLIRGQVDFATIARVGARQAWTWTRSRCEAMGEAAGLRQERRLARDLRRLHALSRPVNLIVAEGDPGYDILLAGARRRALLGIKSGFIRVQFVPGGDHTFTRSRPREDAITRVVKLLEPYRCQSGRDDAGAAVAFRR